MIQRFELSSDQIRVRDVLTNKDFLEIEIYAISNADPNRNNTCFTIESMQKGLDTFIDKPILGFFNKEGDFESHNGKVECDDELGNVYWDNTNGEQILGFIRQSDRREIIEKDGLMWICCTAMIYTQYNYKQVKKLLKDKRKRVSVEVEIKDSEFSNNIEYIKDFNLCGITILGTKKGIPVREGIEGAHLSILELFDNAIYTHQKKALVSAYAQLDENQREDKDLSNEQFEAKSLSVNKSKEAMSDTPWSDVDKAELRRKVVEAENFKEIAGDVFLDLREGWEDGEVTKLKYPVMQLKDGEELVYNRGALASAKAYAEKNGEEEVLKKLEAIYKHLELEFENEDACPCEDFCDLYEVEECVGVDGEEFEEVKNDKDCPECPEGHPDDEHKDDDPDDKDDPDDEDDHDGEDECEHCAEMKLIIEQLTCENEKLKASCDELLMKCHDDEEKICSLEAKVSECEERCCDYDKVKEALSDANQKLTAICVAEQMKYIDEIQCKFSLGKEDMSNIIERCEKHEYSNNDEIDKDIAFVVFKKNLSKMDKNNYEDTLIVPIIPEERINNKSSRNSKNSIEKLKDYLNK